MLVKLLSVATAEFTKAPLVGNVTDVAAVIVNVVEYAPDVVSAPAVVNVPPSERFDPLNAPVAATLVGVIAPRVRVMAGGVVAVATEPLIPLAVVTDTLVTLPVPSPVTAVVTNAVVATLVVLSPAVCVLAVRVQSAELSANRAAIVVPLIPNAGKLDVVPPN